MKKKKVSVYASAEKKYMDLFQRFKGKVFSPLIKLLIKLGITANHLSYTSIISGILFLVFIQKNITVALGFLILSIFLDGIDGPLARTSKKVSSKGTLTDVFSDHSVIVLSTIGFSLINIITGWVGILYIFCYTALIAIIFSRDVKGIPYKWVFRPRLIIYLFFFIYVVWQINLVNLVMIICSIPMLIQLTIGFFKLRKKI